MYGISIWYILVPAITGVAGTLGAFFNQWLAQRSQKRQAETQEENQLINHLRQETTRLRQVNETHRQRLSDARDVFAEMAGLIPEIEDDRVIMLIRKGLRAV